MMWKNSLVASRLFQIAILAVVSALTYLVRVGDLTYFKDDWYYIYDATIGGPAIFREMFSIDRPARGPFFEVYYSLFGPHALPYHLSAFIWRILACVAALWLFDLLWPKERRSAFFMSILFVLYPGYLWWVSAIEYQPMIVSLFLQVFSIALTVKAFQAYSRSLKIILAVGAILSGWSAIWLVDYAIGMEVFRFLCLYLLVRRAEQATQNLKAMIQAVRVWLVYLTIPLGFLLWRTFLFNNERKATDIGLQLGVFIADPATTTLRWFVQLVQSMINVGFLAWVEPFSQHFYSLRLRELFNGLSLSVIVLLIVLLADKFSRQTGHDDPADDPSPSGSKYPSEAIWLGSLGILFGVLPVVLANRSVTFNLSHYALPASLAAVIFITGLIHSLKLPTLRIIFRGALILLAVMTHFAVLIHAISEEKAIQEFWWQVSWRVPGIRRETTLVINYPSASIGDDGFGVMEAPNLIYYPRSMPDAEGFVHYNLSALSPSNENVKTLMVGRLFRETEYRSHTVNFDYKNVLVFSQPADSSCVHVLDGNRPVLSVLDPGNIVLVAAKSNIQNVLTDVPAPIPQEFAFGPEPPHTWCYYFQKADLAVQQGEWDLAASLGNKAMELELTPEDQAEWMPFLEAYTVLGDEKKVKNLSTKLGIDDFTRVQACLNLRKNEELQSTIRPEMQALIEERYCRNVSD